MSIGLFYQRLPRQTTGQQTVRLAITFRHPLSLLSQLFRQGGAALRHLSGEVQHLLTACEADAVGVHPGAGQDVLAAGQPGRSGAMANFCHTYGKVLPTR